MTTYDPFMQTNPVVAALEQHRGRVEQHRENSARSADSYATFETRGDGTFEPDEAIMFGCRYVKRPVVNYGYSMAEDEDGEDLLVEGLLPRATGGVRKWERDAAGFYVGASVFVGVDTSKPQQTKADPVEVEKDPETGEPVLDEDGATTPVPAPPKVFTELFDRANNPLLGRGWQQVGGDFYIDTQRCITKEGSAWLGQPFGHVNHSVVADLRSPDNMQPAVWAWGNIATGGPSGYVFAFSAEALGTNMVLRVKGVEVKSKHFGTAGKAIGNVVLQLKMTVVEAAGTVTVKCYVKDVLQFEFSQPVADAPTGQWSGVGNMGLAGKNGTVLDGIVLTEIAAGAVAEDPTKTPTKPEDVEPSTPTPTYVLLHDFTFTGIALKDVPAALLEV